MKRRFVLALLALSVTTLIALSSVVRFSQAQLDPTRQRQTVEAIIFPRRTLTARGVVAQTSTAFAIQLATGEAFLTEAAGTLRAAQTLTIRALTVTSTPSITLSPTVTPTISLTPTPSTTPSPIDPTAAFQTVIANVSQRLTQTGEARIAQTATTGFQQTINAVLFATLGITETATAPPNLTAAPLSATDQYNTLVANANQRLTATVAAQQTGAAQRTIEAIIASTLSFTATPSASPSPLPTPTPNPLEVEQTLGARIDQSLTQTAEAAVAQTGTAVFEGTLNAILNLNRTATSAVIQRTLAVGVNRILPQTAAQVADILTITGHTENVRAVAFNGNGDRIVSAGMDNTVRLWDTVTGQPLAVWPGLTDRIAVAFSADGSRVAAGSSDTTIRLWDVGTGAEIAVLSGHTGPVLSVAFSPDGQYLASSSADRSVRLWDAYTGQFIKAFGSTRIYLAAVAAVAFSPDGVLLAVGGEDAQIVLWEVSSGVQIARMRDVHRINDIAFSPDGKLLATTGNSNSVAVYPLGVANARGVLYRMPTGRLTGVAFSPEGKTLVASNQNNTIGIWSVGEPRLLATLQGHTGPVTAIAFSPDGTRLLSASQDHTIRIWAVRPPSLR